MSEPSDAELVTRTRAGDKDAYRELVARYQGHVYGLAYSVLDNWADAQDMAQEAFIRAYCNLDQLRDAGRFAAWLRRVTFSVTMNWLKTFRPKLFEQLGSLDDLDSLDIPDFAPGPSELAEKRDLADAVLQAIASLPPKYRVPLTMFHLDGLSYQKVADFLDIPMGTVQSLIHRAREKLKPALAAYAGEGVSSMVKEVFDEHKLSAEFREQVLARIGHWERFDGSHQEKLEMVAGDPEWTRLVEVEVELEPISVEAQAIRRQIAYLEACHEHYSPNVNDIIKMIGCMTPAQIIDCGWACDSRDRDARMYRQALQTWRDAGAMPHAADDYTREVFSLLGEPTDAKLALVEHLIGKLADNAYCVYADEDEDFDLTESRIQHLAICNYNWRENLRIVLKEIATDERLFDWHVPDGYNAHGDCPDRVPQLRELMASVVAWCEGDTEEAGSWGQILGEPTLEKRWLVASLCKHVSVQHKKHGADRLLAQPLL